MAIQSKPAASVDVTLRANGSARRLRLDSRVTLLDALRDELDLTGTKKGCDQGACGAYPNIVAAIREVAGRGSE